MTTENAPPQVAAARAQLLQTLLPEGPPLLWCPPLTHYADDGAVDEPRMAAHFRHLSKWIRGFLIPGSTGDGWELTDAERRRVLTIALEQAPLLNLRLLVGVLKPTATEAISLIRQDLDWLEHLPSAICHLPSPTTHHPSSTIHHPSSIPPLLSVRICGFTVCPPRGKALSQEEIYTSLASVLDLGLPTAIYQLPQVTQNELGPAAAARLADHYSNFILFKDTSGADRVVLSGLDLGGVFTTRGWENDYARWLDRAGGPYRGFLLGAANCFARELHQVINDICEKRLDAAQQLSDRLTRTVAAVSALVASLPHGNGFANSNKAMDHFFAHGPRAATLPPPRLHAGSHLPVELIRQTGEVLSASGLMPKKGYLE